MRNYLVLFIREKMVSATLLSVVALLSGCNEATETNSSNSGYDDVSGFQGALFYYESRYGDEKESTYLKLSLSSLSATRLINDLGFTFSSSKDGNKLLRVDPNRRIIHIYNGNGKHETSVDVGYQISSVPRYSPDNKYIAFLFSDSSAKYYVGILGSEGSVINALAVDSDGADKRGPSGVDWTPDGEIMFTGYGRIYRLPSVTSDSLEVIRVFGSGIETYELRVSPNGKRVAFLMDDFDAWYKEGNLYVMNVDGTDLRMVAQRDGLYAFTLPTWSPNGDYVSAIYGENRGDSPSARGCGSIWIFDSELEESIYISESSDDENIVGAFKIDTADYVVHGMCPTRGLDWR